MQLRVNREYAFEVPPLALLEATGHVDVDLLAKTPSVAHFLERVQAVVHDLT
jgi:hypothetical protein